MGGFKAEPKAISAFGEELDGLVTDANAALADNYERLAKIQQSAATEIDKAAMMYEDTDQAEAERYDSTYPEAGQ